jgi:cell wall-associated NlpC family hydrolase
MENGRFTRSSTGRRTGALIVAASAALTFALTPAPASAHTLNDVSKVRRHLVRRGLSQLGTRYNYAGESPSTGFDCSGFTYWVFKGHAETLPRRSIDQWKLRRKSAYRRIWHRSKLRKGDLVFFKTTGAPVGHVGIFIGHRKFVHASSSRGVRRDALNDGYYRSRYVGAVRVPALRDPN